MKTLLIITALLFAVPAYATTCAHTETGQALDPLPCTTIGNYLARFTSQATAGWQVVIVPDGTQHNAVANGDGTYTNPVIMPPPAPQPGPIQTDITTLQNQLSTLQQGLAASSPAAAQAMGVPQSAQPQQPQ